MWGEIGMTFVTPGLQALIGVSPCGGSSYDLYMPAGWDITADMGAKP
jgi:hypothetical protein